MLCRRSWRIFQSCYWCYSSIRIRQMSTKRTYQCTVEAEDPNSYVTERFFPVGLGDVFKHGKYRVIHKLGWGGYSTVWLARDTEKNSNVALKMISIDRNRRELKILRYLQQSDVARQNESHPGRKAIAELLDDFRLGTKHQCLVLDVMGIDVQAYIDAQNSGRLTRKTAQKIACRIVAGLDYVWKCGIAHGDLFTKNVLFIEPKAATLSEGQIVFWLGTPRRGPVTRVDELEICDPHVPPYLVEPTFIQGRGLGQAKLIDFGNAFFHDSPPAILSNAWHVRAPESLFNQTLDKYVDMWGIGCLLFELFTGRTLADTFLANRVSVINNLEAVLGPPPLAWYDALSDDDKSSLEASRKNIKSMPFDLFFKLSYDQDDSQLLGIEEGDEENEMPIEEHEKPDRREFSEEELTNLSQIIRGLLSYEPKLRGCPSELLERLESLFGKG